MTDDTLTEDDEFDLPPEVVGPILELAMRSHMVMRAVGTGERPGERCAELGEAAHVMALQLDSFLSSVAEGYVGDEAEAVALGFADAEALRAFVLHGRHGATH